MMTNKIVIITGGRGLGRNTAVDLARRGVDIRCLMNVYL
jgi:NAD(P)-dependent dehydrogenase (short-subunit alcohol dehydrogenase family)